MDVAARFLVSGRVQGVGFRYFTAQAAADLGLDGEVRNLADGRVEVHVEGARAQLDQLEQAVRQGPSGCRVDEVVVEPVERLNRRRGFHVTG
jgi:acylphosphatase